MKTKRTEKYNFEHANTERIRKSSIIYMQYLLHEDEVEDKIKLNWPMSIQFLSAVNLIVGTCIL